MTKNAAWPEGSFLDSLATGVLATDPKGKIVYANAASEILSGASKNRLLGISAEAVFPSARRWTERFLSDNVRGEPTLTERTEMFCPSNPTESRKVRVTVRPISCWSPLSRSAMCFIRPVPISPVRPWPAPSAVPPARWSSPAVPIPRTASIIPSSWLSSAASRAAEFKMKIPGGKPLPGIFAQKGEKSHLRQGNFSAGTSFQPKI